MEDVFNSAQIKEICQRNNISYLGLFGSYARGEQTEESDVDLLVKFNAPVGYFTLVDIQRKLEDYLKKDVDLVTEKALSKYMRSGILKELRNIYGKRC